MNILKRENITILLKSSTTSLRQKLFLFFISLLLTLILLEIGLRIGGFLWLLNQERFNKTDKNEYRILCLGESTTALGGYYAYPAQLERILNDQNNDIHFNVINKAIPGAFTSNLLFQLEDNIFKYKPDMVIVMAGINDAIYFADKPMNLFRNIKDKFFKNFRTYKLLNLLRLHIIHQINTFRAKYEVALKEVAQKGDTQLVAEETVMQHVEKSARAQLASEKPLEVIEDEYHNYFEGPYIDLTQYHPATVNNLNDINQFLLSKNIKVINMQYPLRSIEPLKKILKQADDIVYVENYSNFKEALEQTAWDELFVDKSMKHFGHASPRGNRLIAENLSSTILSVVNASQNDK